MRKDNSIIKSISIGDSVGLVMQTSRNKGKITYTNDDFVFTNNDGTTLNTSDLAIPGDDGNVIFNSGDSLGANSDLFWDNTESRLGISETVPLASLHINSGVGALANGIAFGDGDSGIYESTDDTITFMTSGSARFAMSNSSFSSNLVGGPTIVRLNASDTVPVYTFSDDSNTGIGAASADQLSIISGGVEQIRAATSGIFMYNLKSGATQVGAGAAADELWTTSSHATLPDNVVMIGV